MRPQGLAEARRRRREARLTAAVLLVLLFVLAWALSRPGSPASVLAVAEFNAAVKAAVRESLQAELVTSATPPVKPCSTSPAAPSRTSSRPLDPVPALLWSVWRISANLVGRIFTVLAVPVALLLAWAGTPARRGFAGGLLISWAGWGVWVWTGVPGLSMT